MPRKPPGGHRNPGGKTHGTASTTRRLTTRLTALETEVDQLLDSDEGIRNHLSQLTRRIEQLEQTK
jgi:phage shock protein A